MQAGDRRTRALTRGDTRVHTCAHAALLSVGCSQLEPSAESHANQLHHLSDPFFPPSPFLGVLGPDVAPNQQRQGALVYLNLRDYRACHSPSAFPGLPAERADLLTLSDTARS